MAHLSRCAPRRLTLALPRGADIFLLGAGEVSRDFFELIKAIGEARSKQEEHALIEQEARSLKVALKNGAPGSGANKGDDARLIREMLVRLMYCEMLGLQVPFGYMIAINLMQQRSRLVEKRVRRLSLENILRFFNI